MLIAKLPEQQGSATDFFHGLLGFSASCWYFQLVYHAALAAAVLFATGVGGRVASVLFYVLVVSMQEANPLILDGGDNILRIVLFFAMFADLSPPGRRRARRCAFLVGLLHNGAILAIIVQLCLLYFSTGAYKVMGEMWQNGTALYYVSRVHWFTWPGVSSVIYESAYAVVVLTYATVLFEIAFPFMLLNRFTRWGVMAFGVCFHVGIALLMGLVGFSWMMLSMYFVLLTDREYGRLAAIASAARARSWTRLGRHGARGRDDAVVLYDGECGGECVNVQRAQIRHAQSERIAEGRVHAEGSVAGRPGAAWQGRGLCGREKVRRCAHRLWGRDR